MDWFDDLLDQYVDRPRHLISLGHSLAGIGAAGIFAGLWGNVAKAGVSGVLRLPSASTGTHSQSLDSLYPTLWTWWVPETLLGAMPYAVAISMGFALAWTGRRYLRLFH